jgi:hypothetical protein
VTTLIVMRLADMARVHPRQIPRHCDGCGHLCGVYPSGQRVIAADPHTQVLCSHCHDPRAATAWAPGAKADRGQSVPNPKRRPR